MRLSSSLGLPFVAYLCAVTVGTVLAQVPTNASLPQSPDDPQLALFLHVNGMPTSFPVDIAAPIGRKTALTFHQANQVYIPGQVRLTTPSSVGSLSTGQIAYISCDPGAYVGNIDAARLVDLAISRVVPATETRAAAPGAIVLYSITSSWCTAENPRYNLVYTMTAANYSMAVLNALQNQTTQRSGSITLDQNSVSSNGTTMMDTEAASAVPGPNTAMVVLYCITAVITFFFMFVIITGAVRARRHPELYGPRNVFGAPRQSRARGIARALLDTLPIIKVGESDHDKAERGGENIELGVVPNQKTIDIKASEPPSATEQGTSVGPPMIPDTETVRIDSVSSAPVVQGQGISEENAETGLACSVCTEDFVKGQEARVLPCNHKFHPECIDPWLLNVSSTCPLCRVDLNPPDSTSNAEEEPVPDVFYVRNSRVLGYLSLGRMREATPTERVAALRQLRIRQLRNPQPVAAEHAGERRRTINRLSRVLFPERTTAATMVAAGGWTPARVPISAQVEPVEEASVPPYEGVLHTNNEEVAPAPPDTSEPETVGQQQHHHSPSSL